MQRHIQNPVKHLRWICFENADIFANVLVSSFNDSIEKSNFPSILKNASITPVFKKGDKNSKDNYRPVSILPNISKMFERCIFCQLSKVMDQFLSKYQCVFANVIVHNIVY